MEIIKNKAKKKSKAVPSKKIKCYHCKSRLKVVYSDLERLTNLLGQLTSYYFKCPCCGNIVYVSLKTGDKVKPKNDNGLA